MRRLVAAWRAAVPAASHNMEKSAIVGGHTPLTR